MCVPTLTTAGLNEFPVTPEPEKVPPDGEPPESESGASDLQSVSGLKVARVTVGGVFAVMLSVAVFVQPAKLVPVTVYTVVLAGATETLVPLNVPGIQV